MRVFLVAGSPVAEQPIGVAPGSGDRVIAADSGYLHARAWGWPVDLLIGDLDSLPGGRQAAPADMTVITAPPAKDETDLELALAEALRWGAREILISAAFGGRPDHMLANILLLARDDLRGLDVMMIDGRETLRLICGGEWMALTGRPGDLLSLLPIGGPAEGVTTEGLLYPLRAETLPFGQARGISNVFLATTAAVSLTYGCLLVFHKQADG
jgi:thiamine pyrophosphokinase